MSAYITIVGHLGGDPEIKEGANGPYADFNVAVNIRRRDQETTNWYGCRMFGKRAEAFAKFHSKGQRVHVRGELELNEVTDDAGNQKSYMNLTVDGWNFASDKAADSTKPKQSVPDSDIPF